MLVEVKMDNQYTVVVNGVNHVIFDEVVTGDNKDRMYAKFKRYDAIPTRLVNIKSGLFQTKYVTIIVLVPEVNALKYSHE